MFPHKKKSYYYYKIALNRSKPFPNLYYFEIKQNSILCVIQTIQLVGFLFNFTFFA